MDVSHHAPTFPSMCIFYSWLFSHYKVDGAAAGATTGVECSDIKGQIPVPTLPTHLILGMLFSLFASVSPLRK